MLTAIASQEQHQPQTPVVKKSGTFLPPNRRNRKQDKDLRRQGSEKFDDLFTKHDGFRQRQELEDTDTLLHVTDFTGFGSV